MTVPPVPTAPPVPPAPPAPAAAPTLAARASTRDPNRIESAAAEVVTGEAVVLDLRPAGLLRLFAAGAVDFLVYGTVAAAAVAAGLRYLVTNDAQATTWLIGMLLVCLVGVPTAVETLTRGRSVGRFALGYVIVREDGAAIRFRQALVRSVVALVEIWLTLGTFALVSAIVTSRHKRLGDLLSGTYPLESDQDQALPAPVLMPAELVEWARRADISRLPGSLAWRVREFLDRARTVEEGTRTSIARALAAHVEPHVSPPPPWGTHPERFLAAVLVVRRDAEYLAGLRAQQRRLDLLPPDRRAPYGL
ncbi:RDD family protein [Pseudactinotalea sp. HY160]|nr:RDD family protein [Pseudactinotalea sp. HY160]MPV48868.1 RDD family protein [Pseudactinotalea sp. HY160]